MFNIIEQNAQFSSFSRMLVYLHRSIKFFLFKQWHDVLTDSQAEDIYQSIVKFFEFEERIDKLKEHRDNKEPKNPPNIRIRGLLMRAENEKEQETSEIS